MEKRTVMHKLTVKLPPFAPDYSGVCSALFELGGMMIIHDASGCTGNYTAYDEPRWYGSESLIYCSALREIDAVLGNDDKFIQKIKAAADDLSPSFICIMGSPVPMVIGSDLKGIAAEIEAETGIPAFGFSTTGLNYYDAGISDAILAIAKRFAKDGHKKISGSINLLGATPLDFGSGCNVESFCREFEARGFEVVSTFAMGSGLEEIKRCGSAAVNVVLSAGGYKLAQYLKERFGTPYVIGQPVGEKQTEKLCALIRQAQQSGENRSVQVPVSGRAEILAIGEHVTMHSIRSCLFEDYAVSGVDIACPFCMIEELITNRDMLLASEKAIKKAVNDGGYKYVLGDPLIEELVELPLCFIPLPHVAVSSKVYWDKPPQLAGNKINEILKGICL